MICDHARAELVHAKICELIAPECAACVVQAVSSLHWQAMRDALISMTPREAEEFRRRIRRYATLMLDFSGLPLDEWENVARLESTADWGRG